MAPETNCPKCNRPMIPGLDDKLWCTFCPEDIKNVKEIKGDCYQDVPKCIDSNSRIKVMGRCKGKLVFIEQITVLHHDGFYEIDCDIVICTECGHKFIDAPDLMNRDNLGDY